jgi:hypothetical protein
MIKEKKTSMTYSTLIMEIVKLHEQKNWNIQKHVSTWSINELGIKNSAIYFDKRGIARGENVTPQ